MSAITDRRDKDRRTLPDRRQGGDRRTDPPAGAPPTVERRSGVERRKRDRRVSDERRLEQQSGIDQVRTALQLLASLAESGTFHDEQRRVIDTAMLRLRFALDRLEDGA